MPRLRQVSRAEVHESGRHLYNMLFGDRDPVAQPGTVTGTPGNWWTVFAVVPDADRAEWLAGRLREMVGPGGTVLNVAACNRGARFEQS